MAAKKQIATRHLAALNDSAISEEAAQAWGIVTAHDADDLPEDLRGSAAARESVPGIVFPLRQLDGTVVHQLRADVPAPTDDGGSRKYIQPAGVGSVITVPEVMASRVGVASTVLIVEGTKQTVAVCQYVDDTTLVVGVQGSSNWSHDGVPVAELQAICTMGAVQRVEVLFDADVQKNRSVFDAAKRLQQALRVGTGVKDVVFVRLSDGGFGGKAGIDDALGGSPEASRHAMLARLRGEASSKLGRAPAAAPKPRDPLSDVDVEVQMDRGRTVAVVRIDTGDTRTTELFGAAARIIAIEETFRTISGGRLTPTATRLVVEVAIAQGDGSVACREITIDDAKFERVNDWISMLGRCSVGVKRFAKPADQVDIANHFREQSYQVETRTMIERLGWHLDDSDPQQAQWRWMHPHGAIGAYDLSDDLRGVPSASLFGSLEVPDPFSEPPAAIQEAVRRFIAVRDLVEPTHTIAWDAAIGALGLAFLPVPPMTALAYFGAKSAGKSTLAQALTASLSPRWKPHGGSPMMTFNSTPVAMDAVASGVQDCFLHVDDLKPEFDVRKRSQVLSMLDDLLRRAHGSGGRARGGLSDTKDVIVRDRDDSAPMLIVTGEQIPTGGDFADSGLDRMFIVPVPEGGLMRRRPGPDGALDDGGASLVELYASVDHFPLVTAAYVRWVAEVMQGLGQEAEDITQARTVYATRIEALTAAAAALIGTREDMLKSHITSRNKLAAARLIAGATTFLGFAVSIGALTEADGDRIAAEIRDNVAHQAVENTRDVMGDNSDDGQVIMEEIRAAIVSRRATLNADDSRAGVTRIGAAGRAHHPTDGSMIDVVNLLPGVIAQVTHFPTGKSGVTRALTKYALPGNHGHALRKARIDGEGVSVVTIPMSVWRVQVDDEDESEGVVGKL